MPSSQLTRTLLLATGAGLASAGCGVCTRFGKTDAIGNLITSPLPEFLEPNPLSSCFPVEARCRDQPHHATSVLDTSPPSALQAWQSYIFTENLIDQGYTPDTINRETEGTGRCIHLPSGLPCFSGDSTAEAVSCWTNGRTPQILDEDEVKAEPEGEKVLEASPALSPHVLASDKHLFTSRAMSRRPGGCSPSTSSAASYSAWASPSPQLRSTAVAAPRAPSPPRRTTLLQVTRPSHCRYESRRRQWGPRAASRTPRSSNPPSSSGDARTVASRRKMQPLLCSVGSPPILCALVVSDHRIGDRGCWQGRTASLPLY